MKLKSAPVQFKSDGVDIAESGEFEAIVSVFNNVDSWGDVVRPGAFTDTIAEWKASNNVLPVLFSHRMDDPTYNIGEVLDIAEIGPDSELPDWVDPHVKDNGGLWVKGRVDTGPDASPVAVHTLRLMKARRIAQFSYAYDELESGWAKSGGGNVWELRKLKLYEVSPTQIGANPMTELLAAKARAVKAGRTLSTDDEDNIRQAVDLLSGVLDSLDSGADDSGKAKGEEPSQAKPMSVSPESSRALCKEFRAELSAE